MTKAIAILAVAGAIHLAVVAAQEHSYTQADVETGARLYQTSCAGCHGPNGDMVPGVELQRGQFRRATGDADIQRIIQAGIPGTTMPPSSFSDAQAGAIVAYLRSVAPASASGRGGPVSIARGDVAKGRAVFDGKGQCATCHRVNGAGPRLAPDLSEIGTIRPAAELQQKVTRSGAKISGRLLNQDTFTVQLLDANERLVSLSRSDLQEVLFVKSPMPSYRDRLTPGELDDLVAFLVSLKGVRP
jgi:mono/diheme cytochrome c family protein